MKIQEKMRRDWDRRADADPYYWVAATQEADLESYNASAERDSELFMEGLKVADAHYHNGALLDLGCGIGRMTAPLAVYFTETVGVDVSPQMIARARELHAETANLSFVVNSGADLSELSDDHFSVACSYSVLPHLPPDVVSAYFCEVGRVLKANGVFRYQFWVGASHHPQDHDTLGIHVYNEEELAALHERAGLTEISREEIDYFDPVLKLRPLWINARREHTPESALEVERDVTEELSSDEVALEYDLMLHLAFRYCEQDRRPEAEAILERAKFLDSKRSEAYLHWADLRLGQDDFKGALMLLEELTSNCPEVPQGWLLCAQVALSEERFLDAAELLKPLTQLNLDPEGEEWLMYRELKQLATQGHLDHLRERQRAQKRKNQKKKKSR